MIHVATRTLARVPWNRTRPFYEQAQQHLLKKLTDLCSYHSRLTVYLIIFIVFCVEDAVVARIPYLSLKLIPAKTLTVRIIRSEAPFFAGF